MGIAYLLGLEQPHHLLFCWPQKIVPKSSGRFQRRRATRMPVIRLDRTCAASLLQPRYLIRGHFKSVFLVAWGDSDLNSSSSRLHATAQRSIPRACCPKQKVHRSRCAYLPLASLALDLRISPDRVPRKKISRKGCICQVYHTSHVFETDDRRFNASCKIHAMYRSTRIYRSAVLFCINT